MNATTVNQTAEYHSDITLATNGKVMRRRSTSSLILSLVILAAGIGLILLAQGINNTTGAAYNATLIFGIAAIGTGICLALFGGKQWVYLPSKSKVKVQSYYIEPTHYYAVCQAIEMRDISRLPKLKTLTTSSVRLDMYVSEDRQFAAAQAFHYVPYTYNAVTPICCAYGDQAKELSLLF